MDEIFDTAFAIKVSTYYDVWTCFMDVFYGLVLIDVGLF